MTMEASYIHSIPFLVPHVSPWITWPIQQELWKKSPHFIILVVKVPFLLVTWKHPACRLCSVQINLEPHSLCPSFHHPSFLLTSEVTRSEGGTHPSQVTGQMRHGKSQKNLYRSRSEFHMGGRRETQTPTDEADGILNVIYLTTASFLQHKNGARGMWCKGQT